MNVINDRRWFYFLIGLFSFLMPAIVWAETLPSPVGYWHVYDDDRISRGILKITEKNGELQGVIVRAFRTLGQTANDLCTKCKGERHNQPIVGMTVLWGLRLHGDHWEGGQVLNPYTGKSYRAYLRMNPNNQALRLRGYIGVSLLGVNFDWVRVPAP